MKFVDRAEEMSRLARLAASGSGGLAVVYGRRRIGKTRLLLEWTRASGGLYSVADQSAAPLQRKYVAEAIGSRLPGFADVEYPDWRSLLQRLGRETTDRGFNGPVVFDEFPYLVETSPELPSVLQRWLDHEAKQAGLVVALSGSSQRMMQGIVLSAEAPLYGRARELLEIRPLAPRHLLDAFQPVSAADAVSLYAALGGVPRYWELFADEAGSLSRRIDRLVLDPLGPLHREADRLLLEELPPAAELRPILDAIGSGAHRMKEIAGRVGIPATSLSRPMSRLVEMGLVRRETPFGEPESRGKRSLYKIADPFLRLWFRVVPPNRARLAVASATERQKILAAHWSGLAAAAWEDLCRFCLQEATLAGSFGQTVWTSPSRWWRGTDPEWDIVAVSSDGKRLLLGECKWSGRPIGERRLHQHVRGLVRRPLPRLPARYEDCDVVRALFVPRTTGAPTQVAGAHVVTADMLLL